MNYRRLSALALVLAMMPVASLAIVRGGGGGGRGGWDFHGDSATRSMSGPNGASHSTTVTNTGDGYHRSSTTNDGNYNRSSNGGYNSSTGNFNHNSSASSPYGSRSSNTNGNVNSGNYYHQGSGSNGYGSYSNSGTGNYYNRTYNGSGTATNAWGQTYHTGTTYNNGYGYHGAYVSTPYYHGYSTWGWNGGVVWAPAPYYWGGGFWGPFAVGAITAAAFGTIVANNVTYNSYAVQASSPGAKLLAAYHLTQTPCGPPGLIVMYGPNNSVICARPNGTVAAGNYNINEQTLTIYSRN